jgi:branched-chain amino acid transport system permease protein
MCFTHNFWRLAVSGLSDGFLYALIALGYTLVYGVLQLINFAHSEIFMAGAFVGLFAVQGVVGANGTASGTESALLILLGIIAGAAGGAATAFVVERSAYRPLRMRNAPKLAYLISAIGMSQFLQNIFGKEFGHDAISVPQIYNNNAVFHVFGAPVLRAYIIVAIAATVMLIGLDRLVHTTRLGQGIRAVAQDADTARLMGVDIDRVISQTFVIGGLLGGAAGFLFAAQFNAQWNMGFLPGIKAFAAAVLGGIGNIRGAVLGGLVLGVAENLAITCTDSAWRDVISFLILVLVLMFRPTGLLGERLGRSA